MKDVMIDTTLLALGHRFSDEEMKILASIPNHVKVKNHLIRFGKITDREARDFYGYTRLSDAIYRLRYKIEPRMNIETVDTEGVNRFGRRVHFATYYYKEDEE